MTSRILGFILLTTVLETAWMSSAAILQENPNPVEQIAAFAQGSPMLTVAKGPFLMGTARSKHGTVNGQASFVKRKLSRSSE